MNEERKLTKELYRSGEIRITNSKINKQGITGINNSKFRTNKGSAKISVAAIVFDALLLDKNVAVYVEDNSFGKSVYVEMGKYSAIANDKKITWGNTEGLRSLYAFIPWIIYQLQFGNNDELKNIFTAIVDNYKDSQTVHEDALLLFCDSFYYGLIETRKNDSIIVENGLIDSTIQAAFRSGTYTKSTLTDLFVDSKYDKKINAGKNESSIDFLKACKEGQYILPYNWDDEMKSYIPSLDTLDSYVYTRNFERLVSKVYNRLSRVIKRMNEGKTKYEAMGNDVVNALLLGKPGTGKTHMVYAMAAALGMPVASVVWSQNSDEEEGEGKTKIVDGHPQLCITDLLRFHEKGGIILNEEINLPQASVTMGILGQATESPYIILKNGYERIVRHPLTVYLGAMNIGTAGSKTLNQALSNRFKQKYILDDPKKETFISILEQKTCERKEICKWVYDMYEQVVEYLRLPEVNEEDIVLNLSIRTCVGAIENIQDGDEPIEAIEASIVGAVAEANLEVARNLQYEVISIASVPSF